MGILTIADHMFCNSPAHVRKARLYAKAKDLNDVIDGVEIWG